MSESDQKILSFELARELQAQWKELRANPPKVEDKFFAAVQRMANLSEQYAQAVYVEAGGSGQLKFSDAGRGAIPVNQAVDTLSSDDARARDSILLAAATSRQVKKVMLGMLIRADLLAEATSNVASLGTLRDRIQHGEYFPEFDSKEQLSKLDIVFKPMSRKLDELTAAAGRGSAMENLNTIAAASGASVVEHSKQK